MTLRVQSRDSKGRVDSNANRHRGLWEGFVGSSDAFGDRPALCVEGKTLTYDQLREQASCIAASLQSHSEYSKTPMTAVFGYRSSTAFAGVLGALMAGNGYVPLNRTFPIERTQIMFERSGCRSIIVDSTSFHQLGKLLDGCREPVLAILPETTDVASCRARWPSHTFLGSRELSPEASWDKPTPDPDAIAYLLFTSGSTGVPKGVMVAHRNVTSYVDYVIERYEISEEDRFSQMFDMTFDLSAADMFVAWERGACVCCPSQKTLINPGSFIRDMQLTIWFSVPSTIAFMKKLGVLKPRQYPSLRVSLFCGEPLPASSAAAWLEAAPNSMVENLYGPTELTIACTLYKWDPSRSPSESELGIVPIGYPFPGMNVLVADPNLNEVKPGEEGELLMNGPQMSLGYWKDPEKTAAAFVTPPGKTDVYYRTGDRVRRPVDGGPLTHLGRFDFQIKVLGHRVELGEIESVVRKLSGLEGVVAVGWPLTSSGCSGIEVFLEGQVKQPESLRNGTAAILPDYMVPKRFHCMDRLPRNANGKFDRKAMLQMLEGGI
jgi:amino acid adenylation domain-containing protein